MALHFPNHPHYIPVIKWQGYEQYALQHLSADAQERTIPCVEIRTSKQHLNIIAKYQAIRGSNTTLVDYSDPQGYLSGVRLHEFRAFLQIAKQKNYSVIPTLSATDLKNLDHIDLNLVLSFKEVAIREKISELLMRQDQIELIKEAIKTVESAGSCSARILVDMGQTPDNWTDSNCQRLANDIDHISSLGIKNVHFLSGSYPESLASVQTGMAEFSRNDWTLWKHINSSCKANVGFGDYGILNPHWTEETLQRRSTRLALRYTRENDWLILRADGKTKDHSIAISSILVNAYPSCFKGALYSFGDRLIEERADPSFPNKDKKCGHYHITEGWSHHITFVVREQY
jgi:hypothetical protein